MLDENEPVKDDSPMDDGSVVVKEPEALPEMPEDAANLIPYFSSLPEGRDRDAIMKDLPLQVIKDFDDDWESTEDWREKRRKRNKLRYGDLDRKSFPFENCANAHFPVMLERELRLAHRLYVELFPNHDYIFNAVPASSVGRQRAEIVTLHSNYQFRREITDFFVQNRRAIFEFIGNGDAVFHSYRDMAKNVNRHEFLSCEEVVFPYVWKSTEVDMSDVPRKTRILRKYKNELLAMQDAGVLSNVDEMLEADKKGKWVSKDFDSGIDTPVHDSMDRYEGREMPDNSSVAYYTVLEQHLWYQLPGQDRERPVVARVEYRTGKILGLYIAEREDPKDRFRYEKQNEELVQYQQLMAQYAQAQARHAEVSDQIHAAMGMMNPSDLQVLQDAIAQSHQSLEPPVPPKWMKFDENGNPVPPEPVRIVPIEQFSHRPALENIDGSLGFGVGQLLEGFNEAVDTLSGQFIDSATLANTKIMFRHADARIEGADSGDFKLTPGEMHTVRGIGIEGFQAAFKEMAFSPANTQMLEMIKLQLENADGVSSAPDVLSGEAGKANETYRGIATRVEQATRQLSVLAMNYLELLSNVIKNNCILNYMFLEDYELKTVIDPRNDEVQQIEISRDLYRDDFDIVFSADTRFSSRAERVAEADALIGLSTKALPPPLATMIFTPDFYREAVVRALKARGLHDMVAFMRTPEQIAQFQQQQAQAAQAANENKVAAAGHLPDLEAKKARDQMQAQGGPPQGPPGPNMRMPPRMIPPGPPVGK